MTARWIFDPTPPSGARQGGLAAARIIEPELDKFVREVLQNACDQRLDNNVVRVRFTLYELCGEARDSFLEALRWDQLQQHIEAASEEWGVVLAAQLRGGLQDLDSRPLVLLRVDDMGTRGLIGAEDDHRQNFNLLCRDSLLTPEGDGARGGSFGVGKSVLWRFSKLSTVLFSSRLSQPEPQGEFRLFGRTELPFHVTDGGSWSGPGWFGAEEKRGNSTRAVSLWEDDAEKLARRLCLFRPIQDRSGTSILVISFFEPLLEEQRELNEVASDILNAATRWFWPVLHREPSALEVSAEVFDRNGVTTFSEKARPTDEILPFMDALQGSPSQPGGSPQTATVKRTDIPLGIPARRDGQHGALGSRARLTCCFASAEETSKFSNCVAFYRGAGMVVAYKRLRIPLSELPFHAVLAAGLAAGDSDENRAAEEFLRAAEPPGHDDWKYGTERLHANYRQGAKARLDELWRRVEDAISVWSAENAESGPQGPLELMRLFPLGGKAPPPEKFRVSDLYGHLEGDTWHFGGKIRASLDPEVSWRFSVRALLDAETGGGSQIPVQHLETNPGEVVYERETALCKVPAGIREVVFHGRAQVPNMAESDLRRIRLKLQVSGEIEKS